ncbi:MAG TPA: GIY-YIG nuclease family protein [Sphingomicrobium sp.]|nr:GIY-YIG nuclease family protein [Sphingomicrobium sp.]
MMASRKNGTIYTGVTSDLPKRAYEHREGLIAGFTKRDGCRLLVWFEAHEDLLEARRRELQIKEWKRAWKIRLIEEANLEWIDLYPGLFGVGSADPGPRSSPGNRLI